MLCREMTYPGWLMNNYVENPADSRFDSGHSNFAFEADVVMHYPCKLEYWMQVPAKAFNVHLQNGITDRI